MVPTSSKCPPSGVHALCEIVSCPDLHILPVKERLVYSLNFLIVDLMIYYRLPHSVLVVVLDLFIKLTGSIHIYQAECHGSIAEMLRLQSQFNLQMKCCL